VCFSADALEGQCRSARRSERAVKILPGKSAGRVKLQLNHTEHKAAIRVDWHSISSRRLARVHRTRQRFMEEAMRALTNTMTVPAAMIAAGIVVGAPAAVADVITDWDEKAVAVVLPPGPVAVAQQVYTAQRMMGIVHATMFDAVNSIERRY